MLRFCVVLVLTSALAGDLSPEELIARLGSPDRVVREEAARTLEERGDQALPALRTARDLTKTPEARAQLADLIARVGARSLDRPTMVALDFDDKTLGEAVEMLAAQSGFALALDAPALASRRITVRAPGRLPFWLALDRLARAGHVRHDPGVHFDKMGNVSPVSTIRLVAGDLPAFTSYFGPLRIHLFATHRHRDVNFAVTRGFDGPRQITTVTVEIQAFAEPGRLINPNGPPRLEAIDEQGRAIAPQPGGAVNQPEPTDRARLMPGRLPFLQWNVPLGLPDRAGGSMIKIRGVLPLVFTSRNPDPLVIPLAGAVGKTFRQGPRTVRVSSVSPMGGSTNSVDFFLSEEAGSTDRTSLSVGPERDFIGDYVRDRIEFADAQGLPMTWDLPFPHPTPNANGEFRIHTLVNGPAPTQLRIYRLSRLATETPFEFVDVPAP